VIPVQQPSTPGFTQTLLARWLPVSKGGLRDMLLTLYVVLLVVLAGYGVGAAAHGGMLVAAALPFAAVVILALAFLPARASTLAWAAFTLWLGSTYLQTGAAAEYVALAVYALLAALGVFVSPLYLALAWLLHPVWDFLPRELPPQMQDLPRACLIFDLPIGAWLAWSGWRQSAPGVDDRARAWSQLVPSMVAWRRIGASFYVLAVLVLLTFAAAKAAEAGGLRLWALPLAVVPVLAFRPLGDTGERWAWAVLTAWVGMTYAHTGALPEAIAFFGFVALAALGLCCSPGFFALAWLLMLPWNLLPHELAPRFHALPVDSALFCLLPACYWAWRTVREQQAGPAGGARPLP
jgi:hypothetical protein